ncbi:MAG: hypothetical protein GY803_00250, partial [Chloroflexi bacterium]|nr:hypothetical protein [Chloroflexota bacterium]
AARDILLEQAGFGDVQFFNDKPFKVETVENHPIRGYLLSNGLDTYGRTIAFVYTGDHPNVDGSSIYVEPTDLDDSLNAHMLRQGHAYPAFYLSLPAELRDHLRAMASTARADGAGLWPEATATAYQNAAIPGANDLQELVIWPKLFRRLAAFYQDGNNNLADLDAWLRADSRDRDDRLLLPNRELSNMHDIIAVNGNNVRLTYLPEDIVIVPDDFTLPETAVTGIIQHTGPGHIRIMAALIDPEERPEHSNETVTLLNTTNADINLAGWHIADQKGRQTLEGVLAKGETMRVKPGTRVRLNNDRDTITVLDENDQIVDQVSYEPRNLPAEGYT